jgi:hypothetical protein
MVGVGTWGSFVAMRSILASRSALVQVGPLILRSGTGANTISPWDGSRAPSMENYKKNRPQRPSWGGFRASSRQTVKPVSEANCYMWSIMT